jgi:hypothetical protein
MNTVPACVLLAGRRKRGLSPGAPASVHVASRDVSRKRHRGHRVPSSSPSALPSTTKPFDTGASVFACFVPLARSHVLHHTGSGHEIQSQHTNALDALQVLSTVPGNPLSSQCPCGYVSIAQKSAIVVSSKMRPFSHHCPDCCPCQTQTSISLSFGSGWLDTLRRAETPADPHPQCEGTCHQQIPAERSWLILHTLLMAVKAECCSCNIGVSQAVYVGITSRWSLR